MMLTRMKCMVVSLTSLLTLMAVFVLYIENHIHSITWEIRDTSRGPLVIRPIHVDPVEDRIRKVRILCWVTTMLKNLKKKTQYVRMTWGKRCDILLFVGSEEDKDFPVIDLGVPDGRGNLAKKTESALLYVYEHYAEKADWFLKADDDTFVVMDNLKHFLSNFNKSEGLYFGFTFKGFTPQGYNSGGGGYVLSQEALRKFYVNGSAKKLCPIKVTPEDAHIGICMHRLGVKNINTLDEKNRTRFHAYNPITHMDSSDPYLSSRSSYGLRKGVQNISDMPFTFHYLSGREIRLMEFLIYHVRHISHEGTVLL